MKKFVIFIVFLFTCIYSFPCTYEEQFVITKEEGLRRETFYTLSITLDHIIFIGKIKSTTVYYNIEKTYPKSEDGKQSYFISSKEGYSYLVTLWDYLDTTLLELYPITSPTPGKVITYGFKKKRDW